jgi:hypothetical protein
MARECLRLVSQPKQANHGAVISALKNPKQTSVTLFGIS